MLAGWDTEMPAPVTTTMRRDPLTASHTLARSRCWALEHVAKGGRFNSGVARGDTSADEDGEEDDADEDEAAAELVDDDGRP